MLEQPSNPTPGARTRPPLWRRVRAWAIVGLLFAALLAMCGFGLKFSWDVVRSGATMETRTSAGIYALALLMIPGAMVWGFLRRRWTTGRWGRSREERLQVVAQCQARRVGHRVQWSWPTYLYRWGNYTAFNATEGIFRRVLGWTVLLACASAVLGFAVFGLICIGAAFAADNTLSQRLVFLGLAAAILAVCPTLPIRWALRRRREHGTWRTTADEMAAIAEARSAWELRERAKPLGTKIAGLAVTAVVLGCLWYRGIGFYSGRRHEDWIAPAGWTAFAAYSAWVQFRKPKSHGSSPLGQR